MTGIDKTHEELFDEFVSESRGRLANMWANFRIANSTA